MQVKKFEARSMKEALELVKSQLGPDAIILSVRDNNKSYGLVGEGSVEITAAVSEETLQKKKFAESRLREQDRQKFMQSPAKQQKELITRMVDSHLQKNQKPDITKRRYVDIEDDVEMSPNVRIAEERLRSSARALSTFNQQSDADRRREIEIEMAKRQKAAGVEAKTTPRFETSPPTQAPKPVSAPRVDDSEILALKNEIASLKSVISHFQNMPQSFAGAHPGADYGLNYDVSYMFERLTKTGMAPEIAADILNKAQQNIPAMKIKNRSIVDGWVARQILETTKVTNTLGQGPHSKVHCFMGPAGSGKTSMMVKLASHLVVREHKKVALLTTDTFKVGAADQLRIYAQILNVPFAVVRSQIDWNNIMRYLDKVDYVLVDFSGYSLKSQEEIFGLRQVLPPQTLHPKVHLVLNASIKDADATEIGRRYGVFNYQDVIFTALDEGTQHGTIYNFSRRFDIPIAAFGIGPRVPEDFEFATKERMLDLLFRITNQQSLGNKTEAQAV